jgi:hypothetical protein
MIRDVLSYATEKKQALPAGHDDKKMSGTGSTVAAHSRARQQMDMIPCWKKQ